MLKKILFLSLFCFYALKSFAQVPTTDIYLMDMKIKHGKYEFSNVQKISDWKGYNNQPYFTPDGKSIYYVSYRNKQSDVYKYDMKSKATTQFTNTPEDEYSPKLTPNGKYISVVRVMKDSAQQLWEFPLDGGRPQRLLRGNDSIGYYCWLKGQIVTANVPEPMKLSVMDTGDQYHPKTLVSNVGRTLQKLKDKPDNFLFVIKPAHKKDTTNIYVNLICEINHKKKAHPIIATFPDCEDFELGSDNTLYMGCKEKLYKYRIGKDKDWIEIADFSNTEYKNFYRIVINKKGNKIALVSYQGKKP